MIVWIDGTFGVGKTTISNALNKGLQESEVIDFDEYVKGVQPDNSMGLIFGKRYPEAKRCYIDALVVELERKLTQDDKRVYIVPIALITDYCRVRLVEYFMNITETAHIILGISKEKLLYRIRNQVGRDDDLAITYYEEATKYLNNNYLDAIRIDTDYMEIKDIVCHLEKIITDWGQDYAKILHGSRL